MSKISKLICIALSVSLATGTAAYFPLVVEKISANDEIDDELRYIFNDYTDTCSVDPDCIMSGDVYIPDTVEDKGKTYRVTDVPKSAFEYASSVYIGANVEYMSYIVDRFPYLKKITVSPDNKVFYVEDGILFRKITSYKGVPENYIEIYPTCKEDKEYTLPLTPSYYIPDFYWNPYLEKLIIPEEMETGLYSSCINCPGLKSIYIADSINGVVKDAFENCPDLTDIYFGGSIKKWNHIISGSIQTAPSKIDDIEIHTDNEKSSGGLRYVIKSDGTCSVSGYEDTIGKDLKIPQTVKIDGAEYTVTKIDVAAFSDCKTIESVDIPETVTIVEQQAFKNCSNIKNIYTHNSIKSIGGSAFRNCSALDKFIFDDTTQIICDNAFAGCTALKTVIVPAATELIGNLAFSDCSSLEEINADIRNKFFSSADGVLYGKSGTYNKSVGQSNAESESDMLRSVMPPDVSGDVDRNGKVDVSDLLLISLYLLGEKEFDGAEKRFADCNGDGCADIADLAHIKQYVMKDNVELKKGPAAPDESCVNMLEFVRSKTADGSPLDIGYQAAGYEEMYSELYNVSVFDKGYSCSLKGNMSSSIQKDGYCDEYSIVREISDESTEEDIANFQRIINYIDNEAGTESYYIYDMYKKESNNSYYPLPFPEIDDCLNGNGYAEAVSDKSYFVEIVLKDDGEEYKKYGGNKDDYVVTYEIVNKTVKHFSYMNTFESEEIKSELISEYPYHIQSYPKLISIAQRYNNDHQNDPNTEHINALDLSRWYTEKDIKYADTSFTKKLKLSYGMIIPYDIYCCKENDHNPKGIVMEIFLNFDINSEQKKSQIESLVSYFSDNGLDIIISEDVDFSETYNGYYHIERENGQFYLKNSPS